MPFYLDLLGFNGSVLEFNCIWLKFILKELMVVYLDLKGFYGMLFRFFNMI